MKLNERNIDLQYFVDEYAFLLYEEDLELQTISDRLKEFMEYSHSEEIDDLALLLTQGENFINKDQYLKALSKEVNFIRLNQEDEISKIIEILERCKETFEAAIELEEYSDNYFNLNGLNRALRNTDIELTEVQYDHLVWIYYQNTKDVWKLKRVPLNIEKKENIEEENQNDEHSINLKENIQINEIPTQKENEDNVELEEEFHRVASFNPASEDGPANFENENPDELIKEDFAEEEILQNDNNINEEVKKDELVQSLNDNENSSEHEIYSENKNEIEDQNNKETPIENRDSKNEIISEDKIDNDEKENRDKINEEDKQNLNENVNLEEFKSNQNEIKIEEKQPTNEVNNKNDEINDFYELPNNQQIDLQKQNEDAANLDKNDNQDKNANNSLNNLLERTESHDNKIKDDINPTNMDHQDLNNSFKPSVNIEDSKNEDITANNEELENNSREVQNIENKETPHMVEEMQDKEVESKDADDEKQNMINENQEESKIIAHSKDESDNKEVINANQSISEKEIEENIPEKEIQKNDIEKETQENDIEKEMQENNPEKEHHTDANLITNKSEDQLKEDHNEQNEHKEEAQNQLIEDQNNQNDMVGHHDDHNKPKEEIKDSIDHQLNDDHKENIIPETDPNPPNNNASEKQDVPTESQYIVQVPSFDPQKQEPSFDQTECIDNAQDIQELEMHQTPHDQINNPNSNEVAKENEEPTEAINDELNEQNMLEIAENAFSRISQEMLRRDLNVSKLFKNCMKDKYYQDERISVIETSDFIEGLSKLDILDFTEQDLKCLIRVLEKPYLDNNIQIQDLKDILENFGVKETQENQDQNEGSENNEEKKNKKKALHYEKLAKDSIFVLSLFTDYLLDSDTSVYEYFDGVIYNQIIRTKNKQNTVEIISANDFLKKVRNDKDFAEKVDSKLLKCETCSPLFSNQTDPLALCDECSKIFTNVCEVLCLDSNYKHLLLIKKIIKCLEELSHNESLRAKAGLMKSEDTTGERMPEEIQGDVFVIHGDN